MRVLVWNVHGFRAGVERVARVAADLEPDIALIMESATSRRIGRFAQALNMTAHHGALPPLLRRARNAVLIREPLRVDSFQEHMLAGSARWHPRGALVVRLAGGLALAVIHLGLSGQERRRHATELVDLLGAEGSLVLGGDLNELPGRGAVRILSDHFADAWEGDGGETFPSIEPTARIDYLFTRGVRCSGVRVPSGPALIEASDHLPLVVDLDRTASDSGS